MVAKKVKKHHHYAVYASILFVIATLFILNNRSPEETRNISYSFAVSEQTATVDEVASADIAARVAQKSNILVKDNVKNLSDSLSAQVEFATVQESYLEKPQIVTTEAKTRKDIEIYTVKKNDTIGSIARQFNVTSDTIRWANDLDSEVSKGDKLTIPPITGIIHRVEDGDTVEKIASKYKANKEIIVAFNDLEITGLVAGRTIIVPDGVKPDPVAPVYFSSQSTSPAPAPVGSQFAFGSEPLYGGNGYSYGYCTWHAANRRIAIGKPLPRNLGNAVSWASLAAASGLSVSGTPVAGAVLWHKNTYIGGGFGHVAFVEEVRPDGSILVSDMNYGGWNTITTRIIKKGEFGNYLFID